MSVRVRPPVIDGYKIDGYKMDENLTEFNF